MPISVSKYYVSDDMSGNNIYILPDNCPSCSPSFKPKRQHQDAIEEWRLRTCGGIATRVVGQIASARNWQALSGAGRRSIRSLMVPWFSIETNDEARYGLDAPVHRNRWSRGMAGPPRPAASVKDRLYEPESISFDIDDMQEKRSIHRRAPRSADFHAGIFEKS